MHGEFLNVLNNWSPEIMITAKVRFLHRGSNQPVKGNQYTVRLYDKDLFSDDDYLGHAQLNEEGEAHIHFYPTDITNHDLGFERIPDLYILLFNGNTVHFQTKVWENVDINEIGKLDHKEGQVIDFGTFLID